MQTKELQKLDYDIITPQFVTITQTPASIGTRIVARIIDYAIIGLWVISWMVFFFNYGSSLGSETTAVALLLFVYLPVLMYTFLWETFMNGQTPGKRIMNIRVMRRDGEQPSVGNYFIRWICEIVDIGFSCIGLLFMICTRNTQRLGDIAAVTVVVRLDDYKNYYISLSDFDYARRDYKPQYPQVENLTTGQVEAIGKALNNVTDITTMSRLSAKVAERMGVSPKGSPWQFLTTVLYDYQYYAMQII